MLGKGSFLVEVVQVPSPARAPYSYCSPLRRPKIIQVFQPDITMPTVTLDEFALFEMGKLRDQEDRKQNQVVQTYTAKNVSTSQAVYDHETYEEREEEEASTE